MFQSLRKELKDVLLTLGAVMELEFLGLFENVIQHFNDLEGHMDIELEQQLHKVKVLVGQGQEEGFKGKVWMWVILQQTALHESFCLGVGVNIAAILQQGLAHRVFVFLNSGLQCSEAAIIQLKIMELFIFPPLLLYYVILYKLVYMHKLQHKLVFQISG